MDKENTNEALIRFWDSAIRMNEESKEELRKLLREQNDL